MIENPKKFTGLHSHSLSIYDSIGSPKEHIDFVLKNGMDSLALTDHGHQNAVADQFSYSKKLKAKGVKFKPIFGTEAYFIPSLKDWNILYEKTQQEKLIEKQNKKKKDILNTDEENQEKEMDKIEVDKETIGEGTAVENEEETKSNKYKNPLYQRNHLVVLAKNSVGLKGIFRLVSESNIRGFYRYPRIDFEMLREYCGKNVILSQACIGGLGAKIIFDHQLPNSDWKLWEPNNNNFELIQLKLKEMIEQFKYCVGEENYYLELQWNFLGAQHLVNYHFLEAAKKTNTKFIVTCDAHYSNPEHWKEREIYKLLGWQQKDKEINKDLIPSKIEDLKCELYPKNAQQVWESYKKYGSKYNFYNDEEIKNAIELTYDIAWNQIEDVEIDRKVKLPTISKLIKDDKLKQLQENFPDLDEDDLSLKELKDICIKSLVKKNLHTNQKYVDRLKKELDIVKYLKLAKYFLTTKKMLEIVRENQLLGCGRGSGAAFLICYLINITQIDPVYYDLLPERFLNKKKSGAADIDNDCSDREKAVQAITEYFGKENVISISTFSQLQIASLIKDLAKLYGVPFEEVNVFTSKMRNEAMSIAKQEPGFDAQQWVFTLEEAEKNSPSFNEFMEKVNQFPDFEKALKILFKQQKNLGKHAGGILLSHDIKNNMPIIRIGGALQTPWADGLNARNLEDFGFLKFDVLGIGTIKMFENCIKRILEKQGKKYIVHKDIENFYNQFLHPDVNKYNDLKVYENVYWNGNFCGIFQFVKENVKQFTAKLKPTSIIDLAAITSIFRPGPLSAGVDKKFLYNKENPQYVEYIHPKLKEVLEVTNGLILFQEQTQLIFHAIAGYDIDETDKFRKLLNKKDLSKKGETQKELDDTKDIFIKKCKEFSDIDEIRSAELFDTIKLYSSYNFNKAHSVVYAINSYICAWLLTYYPDEWITTYIDYCSTSKGKVSGAEDPKAVAISEAKALGYEIGKPDINFSEITFNCKELKGKKTLIPSFLSLKGVGKTGFYEIEQFRPYNNLIDLLINADGSWRHSKFNKRALETLIKLEAFTSMNIVGSGKTFENYKQMYTVLIGNYDLLKKTSAYKRKNNNVGELLNKLIEEVKVAQPEDWTTQEKIEFSRDLAGSVDIDLVLPASVQKLLMERNISSIDTLTEDGYNWAIVKSITVAMTKTNKQYLKLRVYGESGAESTVFVWNVSHIPDIKEYSVILSRFKSSEFGLSTFLGSIKKLSS